MQADIQPVQPISIRQALLQLGYSDNDITDSIKQFENVFVTYDQIQNDTEFKAFRMEKKRINRFISLGKVDFKKEGKRKLYNLASLATMVREEELFKNEVGKKIISIDQGFRELGYDFDNRVSSVHYLEAIFEMHNEGCFEVITLSERIKNYAVTYFVKESLERFKERYVPLRQATPLIGLHPRNFLINYSGKIYKLLHKNADFHYVHKGEFEDFLYRREQKVTMRNENYSMDRALTELGLSKYTFDKVVEEYSIRPVIIGYQVYYRPENIEFLKNEQEKLYQEYVQNYLTRDEACEVIGIKELGSAYNFETIGVPYLLRVRRDGRDFTLSNLNLYSKSEIEDYKNKKAQREVKSSILGSISTNPFNAFKLLLNEFQFSFSEKATETEKYWFQYVQRKIKKAKTTEHRLAELVSRLVSITEILIVNTRGKEIFDFSEKELNLLFFNDLLEITYQKEIYPFLKGVEKTLIKQGKNTFKLSKLSNPENKGRQQQTKTIYSFEDYIGLWDYVGNLSHHKQKAIDDARKAILGKSYIRYASSWLYVILHLNNAWRHYDITQIPRIDVSRLNIGDLDSFEHTVLSVEDAKKIVNQYKAMHFTHSKTGKKRYFFCSEELTVPFAYAVIICELIMQKIAPESRHLIDFTPPRNLFRDSYHNAFLTEFRENFKFESRKMNRTLISYMYQVIKKITNRNPMDVAKFIRSHSDEEVTNFYVDIPQNHLDFITSQLFEVGYFGYAYDLLGMLLLGKPPEMHEERTERSLLIKEVFGDVYQIEKLAGYLKVITQEREIVQDILVSQEKEKLVELTNLIKLGQQPAKEEGYQCIFSDCPPSLLSRSCKSCPCAVTNLYALSQIGESAKRKVTEFKEKFMKTTKEGERTRLANLLYTDLVLIKQAVERFGEDTVSEFIEGGIQCLREEVQALPSVAGYTTINNRLVKGNG